MSESVREGTAEGEWHKVADIDELGEGRVKTVTVGHTSLCLTHFEGQYGALANHCPHQGGPLGEGSIENGWLRCPWHGYDYHPTTGQPPGGFSDAPACFAAEARPDGIYVEVPVEVGRSRTVSDVLVETMTNWGVRAVFGMVGHSNLGFADALRRSEERGELSFFGIRHEGAAAFAAGAYGKLTGELAACLGIAGPGSTNLLTGLYDAKVDRAPVLAISGQVPSPNLGRGAFQDLDLAAAFDDVAAFSATVIEGADPAELMTLACKHALLERNVGHLILPDEVQVATSDVEAGGPTGRVGVQASPPAPQVLTQIVDRIGAAERPLIIVGNGARAKMKGIVELAETLGAPVATTFKGKGLIADSHPLGCGVLGRSGTPIASWFMNESDLIITFGVSFSNHTGVSDYKPTIQVDFDPLALGRFHPVELPVLGEIDATCTALVAAMSGMQQAGADRRGEVAQRWALWRREKASRATDDLGHGLNSAALFAAMSQAVDDDAVICVDVGNNAYSFGRYFECVDQDVLMSGYLGSIGFALPAAMGAWAAVGDHRQIVSVSGDGGFGQYAMEVTTTVKYHMNITHVLVNNAELGKISKEQRAGLFDVWQTSLHNPNFADFATNCGALGLRVTEQSKLDGALAQALAHDGPAFVEVMADVDLL